MKKLLFEAGAKEVFVGDMSSVDAGAEAMQGVDAGAEAMQGVDAGAEAMQGVDAVFFICNTTNPQEDAIGLQLAGNLSV
ncbi:M55 family metallopeptidase [Collinsella sp. AGMB00827]|uniref:M55 family metallopeptidase n=1 Tax=Collinsella ureilytica TaxID=2869515 RepID=A0ABS7MIP1_9ACTN|nr:M55 family metallopeptidase [Collinsella urealyticum]MBY4796956.1 M55 family metallopeptidase [Collinsella urealyticum]